MVLANIFGPDGLVVVVILVVFGFFGPKLARNLGDAKKEFEKAVKTEPKPTEEKPEP
jgi:Sec-independent protein translocase protein TatA